MINIFRHFSIINWITPKYFLSEFILYKRIIYLYMFSLSSFNGRQCGFRYLYWEFFQNFRYLLFVKKTNPKKIKKLHLFIKFITCFHFIYIKIFIFICFTFINTQLSYIITVLYQKPNNKHKVKPEKSSNLNDYYITHIIFYY